MFKSLRKRAEPAAARILLRALHMRIDTDEESSSIPPSMMPVTACVELAGFAAAHAVCLITAGDPLVPIAVSQRGSGAARITCLDGGTADEIAAQARQWLDRNDGAADRAVTVVDGYITIQGESKIDALVLEIRSYSRPVTRMKMAVPYRRAVDGARFAVHRPKFIVARLEGHDADVLGQAFLRGVLGHEAGGPLWLAALDQSR
jgi:hypothetical protein